jgi:hypothetical protein
MSKIRWNKQPRLVHPHIADKMLSELLVEGIGRAVQEHLFSLSLMNNEILLK